MREKEFDMLVKLYDLPEIHQPDETMVNAGIRILRPMASNKSLIMGWIREHFFESWVCEFEKAMCNTPESCFVAVNAENQIVGFSCYDATARGFFGPVGVAKECRGLHVGKELVLYAMYAMREMGYGYAVIGWVGEHNEAFYHNTCGAIPIPDSFPGVYKNSLFK